MKRTLTCRELKAPTMVLGEPHSRIVAAYRIFFFTGRVAWVPLHHNKKIYCWGLSLVRVESMKNSIVEFHFITSSLLPMESTHHNNRVCFFFFYFLCDQSVFLGDKYGGCVWFEV